MSTDACACCGEPEGSDSVRLLSHSEIVICSGCLDWLNAQRTSRLGSHGGPVRVVSLEPIFTVTDVAVSLDHYRRLGFDVSSHDETYAFADRDGRKIHLAQGVAGAGRRGGSVYLHVDDADGLAESWRLAGLQVEGPGDYDDGKREGSHQDPDGNLIRFGSPLVTLGPDQATFDH